jgi:hypothetical protein
VTFFDPESAQILRNLFQVDSVGDSRAFPDPKEGLGPVGTWFFLMMSGGRMPCPMSVTAQLHLGWIRQGWPRTRHFADFVKHQTTGMKLLGLG